MVTTIYPESLDSLADLVRAQDAEIHRLRAQAACVPELLAALRGMVASYNGIREQVAGRVMLQRLAAADAALAKAEGRS